MSFSSLVGAESSTRFAPAARCLPQPSALVNLPVHSSTTSMPSAPQGSFDGSFSAVMVISRPLTTRPFSVSDTSAWNLPWMESYRSRWASVFASVRSLMATT